MKLSYEACRKSISIAELIISAILKSFKRLNYYELQDFEDKFDENSLDSLNEAEEDLEADDSMSSEELKSEDSSSYDLNNNERPKAAKKADIHRYYAEYHFKTISEESSFDEEAFFNKHYKTFSTPKKSLQTIRTIVVLRCLEVMRGI